MVHARQLRGTHRDAGYTGLIVIRGLRPSAAEVPTVERHARQVLAVYTRLTERR